MRVAEYHVLASLDLKILLHVLTNHFDFAVGLLAKFVYDQVRIVYTEVVEEHWDFEADRALQVTLTVGGANKTPRNVVVATDFGTLRLAFYELVTADVAPRCIIIFLLLASTMALHRPIRPENRHDLCFPFEDRVKELSERVLSDFHYVPLVKVIKP